MKLQSHLALTFLCVLMLPLLLGGAGCDRGGSSAPPPDPILATARPAEDTSRDAFRKPQQVMDFFGIAPGQNVADLMSGAGYYVDQLARRVGAKGTVWAHHNDWLHNVHGKTLALRMTNPDLKPVKLLRGELDGLQLPKQLDAVTMALFYHDLFWMKVDRAALNRKIFASLKPGGVYAIVDHRAAAGAGAKQVESLHRIEQSVVVKEIKAAGFELAASSDLLKHPEDSYDYSVFAPPVGRDRTDRFVLKFVKPSAPGMPATPAAHP